MSRRDIEYLTKRIREELRAEGPDGAGYSDFLILDAMNSALEDLGEVFPVRDTVTFVTTTTEGTVDSSYTLSDSIDLSSLINILKVEYDGKVISNMSISKYLETTIKDEGDVNYWVLWGNAFILLGEVETAKTVTLWVTRAPNKLQDKGDIPETPSYADEAIVAYALSVCYRESKDYERANYHYGIFLKQKDNILRRAIPQGQREALPMMNDSYCGPFRSVQTSQRTDTNPGGN